MTSLRLFLTTLAARISVAIMDGVAVYVAGENLTDVMYHMMWEYPMPRWTVQAGVRWELQ